MKVKSIKYEVSKNEFYEHYEEGDVIIGYVLFKEDKDNALVYFPPSRRGDCGSLSFAFKDGKTWVRSNTDFLNLSNKESKKIEKLFLEG